MCMGENMKKTISSTIRVRCCPGYLSQRPSARNDQCRFFRAFSASRIFTIFFTSAAGRGLSTGKWIVPLDVLYCLSSSVSALITDAVGNKLQWSENAAN